VEDLCAGPGRVESTGEIGAVELLEIAGAYYWRGEENTMQTRIYGTAFEDERPRTSSIANKKPRSAITAGSATKWISSRFGT